MSFMGWKLAPTVWASTNPFGLDLVAILSLTGFSNTSIEVLDMPLQLYGYSVLDGKNEKGYYFCTCIM